MPIRCEHSPAGYDCVRAGLNLYRFDAEQAFVQSELNEDVYVRMWGDVRQGGQVVPQSVWLKAGVVTMAPSPVARYEGSWV